MKSLQDIKKGLAEERPAAWDALPDLELYMDQVLGYMRRQLYSSRPESNVTAAMVNNYIRDGIIPRTIGKKYSRSHIARLTTICVLKQVLTVGDISFLFQLFSTGNMQQAYKDYREVLDDELTVITEKIPTDDDEQVLADAIVRFAITSYVNKIASEQLIDMLKQQRSGEDHKVKKTNQSKKEKRT
jgi:DNA-binding transcriptional MerR regulator